MPDAIILDYHMPGMGTVEFLSSLRGLANGKKPFVVYCTTENDTADITRSIAAGADDYVIKPFDRETLRASLLRSAWCRHSGWLTASASAARRFDELGEREACDSGRATVGALSRAAAVTCLALGRAAR